MDENKGAGPTHIPLDALADLTAKGSELYLKSVQQMVDTMRHSNQTTSGFVAGGLIPMIETTLAAQKHLADAWIEVLRGERDVWSFFKDATDRTASGARYVRLVETAGRELCGSATFEGEEVLEEDDWFRLTYIPPAEGVERLDPALFHCGGCIPYGDGIFRFLPHLNFYERFTERGMPVYAMELAGDSDRVDYAQITVPALVDAIAHFSSVAFEHNERKKMVLEGYCGQGTQLLAYLAAKPRHAERRFSTVATFVAPLDGKLCGALAEHVQSIPKAMRERSLKLFESLSGIVPGDATQMGIDLPLKALFYKTVLGTFSAGWQRGDFADAMGADDLDERQKRDVAGAYWVSPDCSRRYPVPIDIARYTSDLFTDGLSPDGSMPFVYRGKKLSLAEYAKTTKMRFIGFFGGTDPVVPEATGHVFKEILGDRYIHVVHANAGHISYILSPRMWDPDYKKPLEPNPVDLICKASAEAQATT
jgi:hypothetical protein